MKNLVCLALIGLFTIGFDEEPCLFTIGFDEEPCLFTIGFDEEFCISSSIVQRICLKSLRPKNSPSYIYRHVKNILHLIYKNNRTTCHNQINTVMFLFSICPGGTFP